MIVASPLSESLQSITNLQPSLNVNFQAAKGTLPPKTVGAYITAGLTRPGTMSGFFTFASQFDPFGRQKNLPVKLTLQGVRYINVKLRETFPHRSIDAIKGHRR